MTQKATSSEKKSLNLALQGGGAHGAFTWGVLDRLLDEPRITVEAISGTSAGSINAVVFAEGLRRGGAKEAKQLLHDFWLGVSQSAGDWLAGSNFRNPLQENLLNSMDSGMGVWFEIVGHIFSPNEMNPLGLNPLKDLLHKLVHFEKLQDYKAVQLFIGATNVQNGRIRIFERHELTADMILASCCLPKIYPSVKVGEHYYWDGGYMGNPAIFPFFYKTKCEDILIVHINPLCREKVPHTALEIDNRINEISFNSSLLHELRAIEFAKRLVKEDWLKDEYREHFRFDDIRLHTLASQGYLKQWSASSKFNMHWYFLRELFEAGRACMDEWIEDHYDAIGSHSTLDLRHEYLEPIG
jgi:NTE family protein